MIKDKEKILIKRFIDGEKLLQSKLKNIWEENKDKNYDDPYFNFLKCFFNEDPDYYKYKKEIVGIRKKGKKNIE